jgi:hypothetical protein
MKNNNILWTTVAGTCICVILAIIFFGIKFDDFNKPPIYFLTLFKEKRIRDVIYINILIYFLFATAVARIPRPIVAVILFIYFTAMVMALYVYVKYFDKKLIHLPIARPLILAAIVGLFYIAANIIHGLLFISQFSTG